MAKKILILIREDKDEIDEKAESRTVWRVQMKWTKNKPTEPGWYWVEDRYGTDIVYIKQVDDEFYIWCEENSDIYPLSEDAEWAGPIPEPEDD